MLPDLRKLVRRAFPGFLERYQTRLGVVVSIPDAPGNDAGEGQAGAAQATDRFRPRYTVDVQFLTRQGEPDAGRSDDQHQRADFPGVFHRNIAY